LRNFRDVTNKNGEFSRIVVEDWIRGIYPAFLRDGLEAIAEDRSAYYRLRGRFAASLAGLSIASYVLGIGDRHLQNFLVDTVTGELVSIDFGHAFGSATSQIPVPELVPFRLSPQMVYALGPLGAERIAPIMSRTFSAMQSKKDLLLSIASLFLAEPLRVWLKEVQPNSARFGTLQAVAEVKLTSVRRKLDGENPVLILCDEIRRNGTVARYKLLPDVERVAQGEPQRRDLTAGRMSEAQFISVLIDLATDPNIAGHSWYGWCPLF
jgi:DNA-dependent protein kinase catalytic subunit